MLGSSIGNIMRGKLSPVVHRVYAIAARNDKLPPLPGVLNGQEYIIDYISPLARAQKYLELQNLSQAISIIAQFGTVQPDVFDKIDFDECVNYVADITNVTPKILRDDGEVEDLRRSRQDQQAMLQQLEMIKQGAESVKIGGEADKAIAESQMAGATQ